MDGARAVPSGSAGKNVHRQIAPSILIGKKIGKLRNQASQTKAGSAYPKNGKYRIARPAGQGARQLFPPFRSARPTPKPTDQTTPQSRADAIQMRVSTISSAPTL